MPYTDTPDSIVAAITDMGRINLSRMALGEVSFKVVGFSVGRGGYLDPNPVKISPINPSLTDLLDHVFPFEVGPSAVLDEVTGLPSLTPTVIDLSTTGVVMPFLLPAGQLVSDLTWTIVKSGTPVGNLICRIVRDDGGAPSTSSSDIIWSQTLSIAPLSPGIQTVSIQPISQLTPEAGNYWLMLQGDAAYYSVASPISNIAVDNTPGSLGQEYDGSNWSNRGLDYFFSVSTANLEANGQKDVLGFETPTPSTLVINCRLAPDEALAGLGEIGLWAEILNSTTPSEIGSRFMFAVAHHGLQTKTRRQAVVYRFIVQF